MFFLRLTYRTASEIGLQRQRVATRTAPKLCRVATTKVHCSANPLWQHNAVDWPYDDQKDEKKRRHPNTLKANDFATGEIRIAVGAGRSRRALRSCRFASDWFIRQSLYGAVFFCGNVSFYFVKFSCAFFSLLNFFAFGRLLASRLRRAIYFVTDGRRCYFVCSHTTLLIYGVVARAIDSFSIWLISPV